MIKFRVINTRKRFSCAGDNMVQLLTISFRHATPYGCHRNQSFFGGFCGSIGKTTSLQQHRMRMVVVELQQLQ